MGFRADTKKRAVLCLCIRTKRCFAVPPYFACTSRCRPRGQIPLPHRCIGRTRRSLRSGNISPPSVRISGMPSPRTLRAFHQPAALFARIMGLLVPFAEYGAILAYAGSSCQDCISNIFRRIAGITMFLHCGRVCADQGNKTGFENEIRRGLEQQNEVKNHLGCKICRNSGLKRRRSVKNQINLQEMNRLCGKSDGKIMWFVL